MHLSAALQRCNVFRNVEPPKGPGPFVKPWVLVTPGRRDAINMSNVGDEVNDKIAKAKINRPSDLPLPSQSHCLQHPDCNTDDNISDASILATLQEYIFLSHTCPNTRRRAKHLFVERPASFNKNTL